MEYLLTIYTDETQSIPRSPEEGAAMMAAYTEFGDAAREAGVLRDGHGLEPTSTATSVRVRDGERVVTDGPFAETKEQLGGYYLIDCADLDEAIGWAERIPGAQGGTVEVRPIMNYEAFRAGNVAASGAQSA